MSVSGLQAHLEKLPPGPIQNQDEVITLLTPVWKSFSCTSKDEKTTWHKLYRAESLSWDPPCLRFVLERHGSTVNGSTRAALHHWVVDLSGGTRFIEKEGHRQLNKQAERVDVKAIAGRIATVIREGGEDSSLRWSPDQRKVTINMRSLFGGGFKQTMAGRRRRFQAAIAPLLSPHGWIPIPGATRGRFHRP